MSVAPPYQTQRTHSGDTRMSFSEHLEELRTRLFRSMLAVIGGIVVAWNFRAQLLAWVQRPYEVAFFCHSRTCSPRQELGWMLRPTTFAHASVAAGSPPGANLIFTHPTEGFVQNFKLATIAGVLIALPVIFYQLWSFIAPGLYANEKKYILPFAFFSSAFFVLGGLFGYYMVFPYGYGWFLGFDGQIAGTSTQVHSLLSLEYILDFTSQMLLAFGFVFELPLFVFFLALAGVVTSKQLFSFGRYFTVIAFALAAVLTPTTDIYSQIALGAPLVALYLAAALAAVFGPKEAKGFRRNMPSGGPAPK